MELINLFNKIVEYYGQTVAIVVLIIITLVYSMYLITKNYSSLIKGYFEGRFEERERAHAEATQHRKDITPRIREQLAKLAEEVSADRALVFEFSNGSSNLIGLPFLYLSATSEVVTPGTAPVSHQYQKINTSIVAEFLEKIEDKGYYYIENLEDAKDELPIIHSMMNPNGVHSALFYTLRGVDCTIGFMAITTIGAHAFTRDEALPEIACAAQLISSYLNFNTLHEGL